MSAFDDFIQLELPKRPYLDADVAQETVMVRRGVGPRQLASVPLINGQVIAMVGGLLVGTTVAALGNGVRSSTLTVITPSVIWTIDHGKNSVNAIVQIIDAAGYVILPNDIRFTDANTITISFDTAQTGTARAIFLD